MQFKIFVSYSTKDLLQVELLTQQMKETPIELFVAEHSVQPSEALAPKISNAIHECDLFVVLWSNNAQASDWVSQEIGRAGALKKNILPLVLHKGITLPGFISDLKYLSIYEEPEKSLTKAREIIVHLYKNKLNRLKEIEAKKQKEKEVMFIMGAGAFLLWAFSS